MPVYNTGGWVVETVDPAPVHGGAAVLLNENLDVVSLRMYNEADGPVTIRSRSTMNNLSPARATAISSIT